MFISLPIFFTLIRNSYAENTVYTFKMATNQVFRIRRDTHIRRNKAITL